MNQDSTKAKTDSIVYKIKGDTNEYCFSAEAIKSIALTDTLYSECLRRNKELEQQEQQCIMAIKREAEKRQISELNNAILTKDYQELERRHNNLVKGLKIGGITIGVAGVATGIYLIAR